jgi:hypothetical protein
MNQLQINKLNLANAKASELSLAFYREKAPFHSIACINWPEYPYKPDVTFRIAHNSQNILLNYHVDELNIQAVCDKDNGKVWEDSCVEFFIAFGEDAFYYNIECNCIGKLLVAAGPDRLQRMPVPAKDLERIDRWSSLGGSPVENRTGAWEVSLVIPVDIFIRNSLSTLDKIQARGNFYKCGDNLKIPHFVSWNPIKSEHPDFHLPGFFGTITFE